MTQSFSILPTRHAIARLDPGAPVPNQLLEAAGLVCVTRTPDELSIVCPEDAAQGFEAVDRGWRCIKVHGPFAFDEVGILASLLDPLATASIGVFAISTFDTDYILVKSPDLERAIAALQAAGHRLAGEAPG